MCRIPGTWHDSSTVNITVEEFCQNKKRKNLVRHCWRIVPATVEQSWQWLLKNYFSDCWRKNRASHCWAIVPVTVGELCQRLLMNCVNGCWTVMPAVFFLFLTYFGKILTSFSITTISASRILISNYLHIFIIHVLPTFVTFQKLNQTQ